MTTATLSSARSADSAIVRAAIYPAIGIARVGNSPDGYFIGPEAVVPTPAEPGFYKDPHGALKRQAARFRVYGLNAAGEVVRELTAADADIRWTVHVANKKAAWYEFNVAMDIPQAVPVGRRNANFTGADRQQLVIDPGPRAITGCATQGPDYCFDSGTFMGEQLYLGELRTDKEGRLLFLGGYGVARTPFQDNPPTTFANNDGWCDDTSDGPVEAQVSYQGRELPVQGAWVVCGPPNYAPDVISVQTMYDVVTDAMNKAYLSPKPRPSFQHDIYPLLSQFSQNQWVNQGFYVAYGHGQPYDFADPDLLRRLSTLTRDEHGHLTDDYREYRRQIFNYFRSPNSKQIEPQRWPWMYGDNMNVPASTPNAYFTLTKTLYRYLTQWAQGDFEPDYDPAAANEAVAGPGSPQQQADMLTKAALWYCLGGPFHPGCELTWPMRLTGMYAAPYRIRRRSANNPEPDYGPQLSPDVFADTTTTPAGIFWSGPGDLTRWMATPWQTDTASCRAGYESQYDPLVPTFWPARVPNTVLTEQDYETVMDETRPRSERIDAFNRRASWYRILGENYLEQIQCMVERYGDLGIIERRPGVSNDPALPAAIYVETAPFAPGAGRPPLLASARGAVLGAGDVAATDPVVLARQELAVKAAQIPYDRGRYVGHVGRAAAHPQPAPQVVITEV
jgi:L-Lysine epsilon oxidase N-terminal/L-lysine epsilon oxidase C-terminal domain